MIVSSNKSSLKVLLVNIETDNPYTFARLEQELNASKGWIRFMENAYLVKTKRNSQYWYGRIKPILKPGEHIFISKVDLSDRQGWLSKSTWEFIRNATL